MELRTGDIGFVMHHNNPLSRIIAWFMKSRWSHSFLVLETTPMGVYILETSDFEVMISPLTKYLNDSHLSMEIWRPKSEDDAVRISSTVKAREATFGKLYGYISMFWDGVKCLLGRIGVHPNAPAKWGPVCCTVPLTRLSYSDVKPFSGMNPNEMDTNQLYVALVPVADMIVSQTGVK